MDGDTSPPETIKVPTNIQDLHQKLIQEELNIASSKTPMSTSKKPATPAQVESAKYARECKRLKAASRENDRQITNSNLDFIYRRLTNIDNQLKSMVDVFPNYANATYSNIHPGKRTRKVESDTESDELKDPTEQKVKKPKREEETTIWSSVKEYAARGALVFGAGLVFSLAKHYIHGRRTTNDGDEIGGYYIGKDI